MNTTDIFPISDKARAIKIEVASFINTYVIPGEKLYKQQAEESVDRWSIPPVLSELKAEAKKRGLWNLFLPNEIDGRGLSNIDYAPIAELMGHSMIAPEIFNCQAPDSGNMELLHTYGSQQQKEKWLAPLLSGDIRSGFMMTEPDVASSDATNIATTIKRDGDDYIINGRKWWITNAGDPRCEIYIIMGKTDLNAKPHQQQSMILVPTDTTGLKIERMLKVFGYDDAPHGHAEITLENVRVPADNLILGEGRGFEIAQGRLGPGRIHHCMRIIGSAEACLTLMCSRLSQRVAFGKTLAQRSIWQQRIADLRIEIDMCRLLTMKAALMMDIGGNKAARKEIAMIKVAAPRMAQQVSDMAMQAFGAAGLSQDTMLPRVFAGARALRFADGPDEVHAATIANLEIREQLLLAEGLVR